MLIQAFSKLKGGRCVIYGKVASSKGIVTLDETNEYSVVLDHPIEYLRIYRNDFSMLLYLNDSEEGIFIEDYRRSGSFEFFEIKGIGIHKFRVSHTDILDFITIDQAPFSFSWFGLY